MTEEVKGTETKNQDTKKGSWKVVLGGIVLVAIIAVLAVVYLNFRQKPVEGAKAITIEVVDKEQKSTTYDVHTDAEYLRQAMEEAGLEFTGTEGDYGMMVDSVNGVKADYNVDGAYWSFYVDGKYCDYSIDTQPVHDGDVFQIRYEVAATE